MKKTLLIGILLLPIVMWGGYFALRQPVQAEQGLRSGTFDPPREAPAFVLSGSNGREVSLHDHLGKVVIVEFGYTNCTEVCPVWLNHLSEVFRKLGSEASDVQLIYVTIDPKRDTPERLREHLAMFNPSFLGATGAPDQLAAVQKAYGVVAEQVAPPTPDLGYAFNHSTSLYLVDRQGKLRGLVPFGTSADDLGHDLAYLLKART